MESLEQCVTRKNKPRSESRVDAPYVLAPRPELNNTTSSSKPTNFGYPSIRGKGSNTHWWERQKWRVRSQTHARCKDESLFFGLRWGLKMEWVTKSKTKITQNWLSFSLLGQHSYTIGRDQNFCPGILIPDSNLGPITGLEPQCSLLLIPTGLFIWMVGV